MVIKYGSKKRGKKVTRPMFNDTVKPKRKVAKRTKKTSGQNKKTTEQISSKETAVAIWDLLKPYRQDERSIDIVLDCLEKTGIFQQFLPGNVNMSASEMLSMVVAKFVLQTCEPYDPKVFNLKDYFRQKLAAKEKLNSISSNNNIRNTNEKPEELTAVKRKPIIRPSFKERFEAKVVRTDYNVSNGRKLLKYDIPKKVIKQYGPLMFEERLLKKLLRPQIFFDFKIKSDRSNFVFLGRVVFQLFTEACPAVVLELVKICAANQHKNFNIRKVFKTIWMEGEFSVNDSPILDTTKSLGNNSDVIDHLAGPGILSFSKSIIFPSAVRDSISFALSFSALKIPSTQPRIAFGVIHRGHWVIKEIEQLGRTFGKPLHKIKISKCGAINYI